jgi:D-beta-D-heptose 7-phosphate kinase / D-beta-D-heptose 1-phosphate adenosyltransferase
MSRITVIGDVLWDVELRGTATRLAPDAPVPVIEDSVRKERPGGAALAAILAARQGHEVTLLSRLSRDDSACKLRARLSREGVELIEVPLTSGSTPIKMRVGTHDQVIARFDSGLDQQHSVPMTRTFLISATRGSDAILVSDYGRGITSDPALRRMLPRIDVPVVWDPHPLGARPVQGVFMTTPNLAEASQAVRMDEPDAAVRARNLREYWLSQAIAVTLSEEGVGLVTSQRDWVRIPADHIEGHDTCGAGDQFAAAVVGFLAGGPPSADEITLRRAVEQAVKDSSQFVADGAAGQLAVEVDDQARDADSEVDLRTVRGMSHARVVP